MIYLGSICSLGGCRFNQFRFAENSLLWLNNLSHSSHKIFFSQLVQFFILCEITTPWLNDFFHFNGTLANNLSPSNVSKNSFLSKLSPIIVKPLKVPCSSIVPNLVVVKQFCWELETVHRIFHRHYNGFFPVIVLFQLLRFYSFYPNVYFQYIDCPCLHKINPLYKVH